MECVWEVWEVSGRAWISRIAAVAFFFLFIGVVLTAADRIVRAKFMGDSTTIVQGFYAEKRNDIDMIVIGSSNSFCTVDPITLYEQYGIAAYDFGSSSQPMNISVLYLKEALKTQKPKVVALEVNMMSGGDILRSNEAALRWGYTDIPFSLDKLKSIYQSLGRVDAEYFSYVFPILRYHNRWRELGRLDYTYFCADKTNYTKGYLESQAVAENGVNLNEYDFEGAAWIPEINISYLDEFVRICRKENVELLLFKSPKVNWHRFETEAIRELADARGVKFVDYNELVFDGEITLDMDMDFRDDAHLNDFGAKKVTSHLGEYIKENYELPDRRQDEKPNAWDVASRYRLRCGPQEFMAASSARECLTMVQNDMDYVLIVTDTKAGDGRQVRQWVYQDRAIALDIEWQEDGFRHIRIGDSELVLTKIGGLYQVLIDGEEHYQTGGRWNIIVYDKVTGGVVANLIFNE